MRVFKIVLFRKLEISFLKAPVRITNIHFQARDTIKQEVALGAQPALGKCAGAAAFSG